MNVPDRAALSHNSIEEEVLQVDLLQGASTTRDTPAVLGEPERAAFVRPVRAGKFFYVDGEKFYPRGVTYGAFRPDENGQEYPDLDRIDRDFEQMAACGFTAVRIPHTMPPRALLDIAARHGLYVMVGLSAEHYAGFLIDAGNAPDIAGIVREKVRAVADHPAILCYALGNEIPAAMVRWIGRRRVERYLKSLYDAVKDADPDAVVTYVNYPTTEYLQLPFLDVVSFNVYLEEPDRLEAYLGRLHNIAGDRPLIMSEVGLDALRNGEALQAEALRWQLRTVFASGCAAAFVFAWTDEWFRAGEQVDDWEFGLTTLDREPKPALHSVGEVFAEVPFPQDQNWPRFSVLVCSYNGGPTIRETLAGIMRLDYPDYEVIVVDDGSVDNTAAIAAEFDCQLIRTPNQGLSAARNVALHAATGEYVAYIDDDAYPDPHWLQYLAHGFRSSPHVGIGGPNLPPAGDGLIADCVANAPGGPVHVLISDDEAEHIPGCNMAFRRSALVAVGGFDPTFRVAGDDVDLCWRLQRDGWTLGFSPAALVWHHRRNSVRTYWKQQRGYGRAESLLEKKWPRKYNQLGHVTWHGHVYGPGLVRPLSPRRGRIYQGVWGSAPFQSLYQPAAGFFSSLPLMPEWYLLIASLAALSAFGLTWPPLLLALPLLFLAVGAVGLQAIRGAASANYPTRLDTRGARFTRFGLTAGLYLLQPAARLWGRWRHGLTPWRSGARQKLRGQGFAFPAQRRFAIWSDSWRLPDLWLEEIETVLQDGGATVRRSGQFDSWDLEIRTGIFGSARIIFVAEDHPEQTQYIRIRAWPVPIGISLAVLASVTVAVLAGLVLDPRYALATGVVGIVIFALLAFRDCGLAMARALHLRVRMASDG